jgi:hypothetical protein
MYFPVLFLSDGFPRVTDIADRTGITYMYVTHGKMIYFAHALSRSKMARPLALHCAHTEVLRRQPA